MKNVEELLGYQGKTVVITGAAAGMAKSATELLLSLGAKVYAVDRNETDLPVFQFISADLSQKATIDEVVAQLPEKIDALFMCHGVGIGKGKEKFIQMVNFVGQRYMVEELLPRITDGGSVTFISSTGGYGWEQNMQNVGEVLACPTFEATEQWVDEHLDLFTDGQTPDPYQFSKQCVTAYVKSKTRAPEFIDRKIRINAIGPSFTSTALIKEFNLAASSDGTEAGGAQVLHDLYLKSWNGRPGLPEEMGYPLVFIGSDLFSYLSGQVLYIDFGLTGEFDFQAASAK